MSVAPYNPQKKALVTGGCHGLGRALLDALQGDGWQVTVIDHDAKALQAFDNSFAIDLSEPDALDAAIPDILDAGPFDLVVLNAGISATGNFEDIPASAYQKLLAINTEAPMVLANELARNRDEREEDGVQLGASIVFISSLSHAVGYPGAAVYAASKDAIATYAKSIRKPFRDNATHVMTVFPGPIKTDHAERHAPKGADAEKRMEPAELAQRILKAVKQRKKVLYPGGAAAGARFAGKIAPTLMAKQMRKLIFDKLDKTEY